MTRSTPWGNPFTVNETTAGSKSAARTVAVDLFEEWLAGTDPWMADTYAVGARTFDRRWVREHVHELAGRDLACVCPPEDNCHAAVLLQMANDPSRRAWT